MPMIIHKKQMLVFSTTSQFGYLHEWPFFYEGEWHNTVGDAIKANGRDHMLPIISAKMMVCPGVRAMLLLTGDTPLGLSHMSELGVGSDCNGKNLYGVALMNARQDIRGMNHGK